MVYWIKLKAAGQDPNACLEQSERKCWTDVYAVKEPDPPAAVNGKKNMPWWMSDTTIIAKGEELGIKARPGETIHDYKGRLQAHISGEAP